MSRTALTIAPPVMEARRWLEERAPDDLPLLNVSQAAPTQAPHPGMVAAMVEALAETDTHLYGPVLGLPALREAIAARWTRNYGGEVRLSQVGITSGCNEAFAATISMLCGEGDEVILPTPFYFNHKMWLDMAGVETVPLPCGAGQVPEVARAKDLISARTRAIVLVSPNNPTGAEYPADTIGDFYALCRSAGIALIIDETYRDFLTAPGAPHALFQDDEWPDTLVHLYSFSKAYRLTGHRIGAVITSEARLAEIEKYLDTVTVCPTQLAQKAALWGMENLDQWLAGERDEILARRDAILTHFPRLASKGWELLGAGAYFAYVRFPFPIRSDIFAQKLVEKAHVLCLPGTMFEPAGHGERELRIAYANIDADGIATLFDRLEQFDPTT